MPELPEGTEREPQQTAAFWRALQRAAMHVQSSGKEFIDGGNLLVAFYRERDSHAVWLLEQQGVKPPRRAQLRRARDHQEGSRGRVAGAAAGRRRGEAMMPTLGDEDGAEPVDDPLAAYTVNFVEKAAAGRDRSAHRARGGGRARDPGAGAAAQEQPDLRRRAGRRQDGDRRGHRARPSTKGKVPSVLQDHVIYSLDMGALLAGTKFRGQFEERLKGVIKAIVKDAEGDPVHRRDPHHRRRGRDVGRLDGRVEPLEAGAGVGRAALHRLDDVPRVQAVTSSATARWRGASRRSRCTSRRSTRPSRS